VSVPAHAERAASADAALKAYMSRTTCDCEECLVALLADLTHWADKSGIGFEGELYRARCRYVANWAEGGCPMSAPTLVSIDERRYAALIEALKLALFALNIAPRFKAGLTDSYRIAEQIERALSGANEPPYGIEGIDVLPRGAAVSALRPCQAEPAGVCGSGG
jgi:hypothetical protein